MIDTSTLRITHEMLLLISELDEFKGSWQALGKLAPDRLQALRRVATIASIGSSTRIEGSHLSDSEVERLLTNLEMQSFQSRDEQEVAGYANVMETVFQHFADITLSENHIKQLHRDLLQFSEKDQRHRGEYKTLPNNVEAFDAEGKRIGVIFKTASPFETPESMRGLASWWEQTLKDKSLHPLIAIAVFIVVFLALHPFQDGNGRLSRILTTLALLRAGYIYVPYCSLESIIEQDKENYYLALRRTQCTIKTDKPDWQPWLVFFLSSLQKQKAILEKRIGQEKLLVDALPPLSLQIMDIARQRGRITVSEAAKITGASRNTIKDHVKALVAKRLLTRHGAGRSTWYSAT